MWYTLEWNKRFCILSWLVFFYFFPHRVWFIQWISASILHWNFFLDRGKALLYILTTYCKKNGHFRYQCINVNNSICENCSTVVLRVQVKVAVLEYSSVIFSTVLETLLEVITNTLHTVKLLTWSTDTKIKLTEDSIWMFAQWDL